MKFSKTICQTIPSAITRQQQSAPSGLVVSPGPKEKRPLMAKWFVGRCCQRRGNSTDASATIRLYSHSAPTLSVVCVCVSHRVPCPFDFYPYLFI